MWYSIIGFINNEDEVENYLSLEIPVFSNGYGRFIQIIDETDYTIKEFEKVPVVIYVPLYSEHTAKIGEEAVYVFKYNKELFIGTKKQCDNYISKRINASKPRLLNFNLYSLYTFLGLRNEVINVVDKIINEEKELKLSRRNFVIPDEIAISDDDLTLCQQAVSSYANVFFSLKHLSYASIFQADIHLTADKYLKIHLGFYSVTKRYLIQRLQLFSVHLPQNDADFRLNDFIIGILNFMKETLPVKARYWNYIPNEVVKSDVLTDNDVVPNIRTVQIMSSTTFYLMRPTEEVEDMPFTIISHRMEKSIKNWNDPMQEEIKQEEVEQLSDIKNHIIAMNIKKLVR